MTNPATETETPTVVLSYGMGVDSTAILLRWLEEPESRDFELENLIVLTAQVGDEFRETGELVERHILPRLRAAGVRFVQVARAGASQTDGVARLDDSRSPTRVFLDGAYKLSDELTAAGTVPQYASGCRRCSLKAKGWPLDTWIEGELRGAPFRHVMGFNADEMTRVERDRSYSSETRRSEYPLITWGWGRKACEDYIASVVGEEWLKSCCTFCPFAGGKTEHLARLRRAPEAARSALMLEYVSTALNPRVPLYKGVSLRTSVEKDGNVEAIAALESGLDAAEWTIYHVRRIMTGKGIGARSVRFAATDGRTMSRSEAEELVRKVAAKKGLEVDTEANAVRVYGRRREEGVFPTAESFLVACPAVVAPKEPKTFDARWAALPPSSSSAA